MSRNITELEQRRHNYAKVDEVDRFDCDAVPFNHSGLHLAVNNKISKINHCRKTLQRPTAIGQQLFSESDVYLTTNRILKTKKKGKLLLRF